MDAAEDDFTIRLIGGDAVQASQFSHVTSSDDCGLCDCILHMIDNHAKAPRATIVAIEFGAVKIPTIDIADDIDAISAASCDATVSDDATASCDATASGDATASDDATASCDATASDDAAASDDDATVSDDDHISSTE